MNESLREAACHVVERHQPNTRGSRKRPRRRTRAETAVRSAPRQSQTVTDRLVGDNLGVDHEIRRGSAVSDASTLETLSCRKIPSPRTSVAGTTWVFCVDFLHLVHGDDPANAAVKLWAALHLGHHQAAGVLVTDLPCPSRSLWKSRR